MISIVEHLNKKDPNNFLKKLSEEHWKNLNPKLSNNNGYKKSSLRYLCKLYKANTKNDEYLKEYAEGSIEKVERHRKFFSFLLDNNAKNLKKIVVSKPDDLEDLRNKIFNILHEDDVYNISKSKQTMFGKLLSEKIFNYKKFRRSNFCKSLFVKLNFSSATCPYCNDNKVIIVDLHNNSTKEEKLAAYMDLDHFFSKSKNPFFAVSLFNLIPSCNACNSKDKRDKIFTLDTNIHPYIHSFDDFYDFDISPKVLVDNKLKEIEIKKKSGRPKDRTLIDFKLKARYNAHIKEAESLIEYYNNYKHYLGTVNETVFKDAVLRDIAIKKNDILLFQRSKLKRDILKILDIDKKLNII